MDSRGTSGSFRAVLEDFGRFFVALQGVLGFRNSGFFMGVPRNFRESHGFSVYFRGSERFPGVFRDVSERFIGAQGYFRGFQGNSKVSEGSGACQDVFGLFLMVLTTFLVFLERGA